MCKKAVRKCRCKSVKADRGVLKVRHADRLSGRIGRLYLDQKTSDLTLRVQGQPFPAHGVIIASSSDRFSALVEKMKASNQNEIVLIDVALDAFRRLLGYIYTGNLNIDGDERFDLAQKLLRIADQYGFEELRDELLAYLKSNLTPQNVPLVFEATLSHPLPELEEYCCAFMDRDADAVVESDRFSQLSAVALEELLSRDTFCPKDIDLSEAVDRWIQERANRVDESRIADIFAILEVSLSRRLSWPEKSCYEFMDDHADEVLQSASFTSLSAAALEGLISRTTFCAKEIEIFKAVHRWISSQPKNDDTLPEKMLAKIRLSHISLTDLANTVWDSGRIKPERLMNVIREKVNNKAPSAIDSERRHRLEIETNVASSDKGATVIAGLGSPAQSILRPSAVSRPSPEWSTPAFGFETLVSDRSCTDAGSGIVIRLAEAFMINSISMRLLPRTGSHSFFVEVSLDRKHWSRVIDHLRYPCDSEQHLFFEPQVVRYVRVGGVYGATSSEKIKLESLQAFYTKKPYKLEGGLLAPTENVASSAMGAHIHGGKGSLVNAFIIGTNERDSTRKVFRQSIRHGAVVIKLAQPYSVSSLGILLWDGEKREINYSVEVSPDNIQWTRVASFSEAPNHLWQLVKFQRTAVVFIKIDVDGDSVSSRCIVDIQCPAGGFA